MEQAKKKKIRAVRVVMTNIFMGVSVVVIVTVLTLIAMGYTFNKDWELKQSGLIQVSSWPSDAIVEIDGGTQSDRTEMSKMLSAGEHRLKVSKLGYDVWERTLDVDSGLFTRVDWVRLFPVDKEIEEIRGYASLRMAGISPNSQYLLLLAENSATMQVADVRNDDVAYGTLDLRAVMGLGVGEVPGGSLAITGWNKNSDRFLLKWVVEEKVQWLLMDIRDPSRSINLSTKFLLNFNDLLIASDAADKIWGLEGGNLRLINTTDAMISGVLVSDIEFMANNARTVAYVRNDPETGRSIGIFKDGEQGGVTIQRVGTEVNAVRVALGSYWGDDWIAFSMDSRIFVRSGTYPSYGKPASSLKVLVERDLKFSPEALTASPSGRFVAGASKRNVVMTDVELRDYWEYEVGNEVVRFNWLDNFLTWEIWDNKLVVRDFDGHNRREVSEAAWLAAITENNRWLYFVTPVEDAGFALKRMRL